MSCEYNIPDANSNEAGKGWRFCKKEVTHETNVGDFCHEHAIVVANQQDDVRIRNLKHRAKVD